MDANSQEINNSLHEWRAASKGNWAIFFIKVVVPVFLSIGLSLYFPANVPSGAEWFSVVGFPLSLIVLWVASYHYTDQYYQKINGADLVASIDALLSKKDNLLSVKKQEITDLTDKLVSEMVRNDTLSRVSNGRIRKIVNYYEAGHHDPFKFIAQVLNEKNGNGIDSVLEALTLFYSEVRLSAKGSHLEASPSLRASLWIKLEGSNELELIASKSNSYQAPTGKGCRINIDKEGSRLQSLVWNSKAPKAFSRAKDVAESFANNHNGAPFDLNSGWAYKFSSACCIPIECPETATILGVLWIDTNVSDAFKGDPSYQLDESQWKEQIMPLMGPFIDRLAFYMWLKKCADAIDLSLKFENDAMVEQLAKERQ